MLKVVDCRIKLALSLFFNHLLKSADIGKLLPAFLFVLSLNCFAAAELPSVEQPSVELSVEPSGVNDSSEINSTEINSSENRAVLKKEINKVQPLSSHMTGDQCQAEIRQLLENYQGEKPPVVGRIQINRADIFNTDLPEEDNIIFRTANLLHVTTNESTIKQKLLFREGDPVNPEKICESQRILRGVNYLDDVRIDIAIADSGETTVNVHSKELWTLSPEIKLSHSGGSSKSGFGFQDSNFLGAGKDLWFQHKKEENRTSDTIAYRDQQLFGSHYLLDLKHGDNSDGKKDQVDLMLPFYSLDTRYSYGVKYYNFDRDDTIYVNDDSEKEFTHREAQRELFWGFSPGRINNQAQRWIVGLHQERHRFDPTIDLTGFILPEEREINYPFIGFEQVEDQFATVKNYHTIQRDEDLFLGLRYSAQIGFAAKSFNSDEDRLAFKAAWEDTLHHSSSELLQANMSLEGYWNQTQSEFENAWLFSRIDYFFNTEVKTKNILSFEGEMILNPTRDQQLILDGSRSDQLIMRGYSSHYQAGDRRILFSAERRYYFERQYFKLFYLAAAGFVDIGRVWDADSSYIDNNLEEDNPWLGNIGVGLRISQSRLSNDKMIHMDLAFPFLDRANSSSVQWGIQVRKEI